MKKLLVQFLPALQISNNAIIGIAVGFTTSASFLALKICTIRKHLFDNDSSERRSTNVGFNGKEMMLSPISAFA